MPATLEDKLARLPDARRARVEARAAELIAEEMTLHDLRLPSTDQRGA
jgi:hypothetical protein